MPIGGPGQALRPLSFCKYINLSVSTSASLDRLRRHDFHSQDGERIALVIGAVTAEHAESHTLVEFHG